MTDWSNQQLGKYQVKELLGRGAMAEVYKAFQPGLERSVAIKVIHTHLIEDPTFVDRFKHEAKIVAGLRHPGIVQVHDFDVEGDTLYMVMEFVPGESLQERLAEIHCQGARMPLTETLRLFRLVVEAVAYAHNEDVLHRDLKPANVLLTPQGQPILADFGLSAIMGVERMGGRIIVGTPIYMSPEQGSGLPGDERSDIYSLGVMLYELATGIPPFNGETAISIIIKHLDDPLPPPCAINPDLPVAVEQIILKALEKEPAKRYQTATALLAALVEIDLPERSSDADLTPPLDSRCPYRGLQVFEAKHADLFFGREALIRQLVEKIESLNPAAVPSLTRPPRLLAVIGASGSGKSSLVRAGLVPALQTGAVSGSHNWTMQVMKPGSHPLAELAAQLSSLVANEVDASEAQSELLENLSADGRALHQEVRRVWPDKRTDQYLLLVVDQFEEAFTLCHDEAERQRFIENLLYAAAASDGQTIMVFTMRADFYHRCADYRDLASHISTQQVLVGPMNEAELRRAIEQPARQVGLKFEPGLVDTILADVAQQPGALPLLQHALLELWERREGRLLTLAAYQASGRVSGAIAQRADTLLADFSLNEQAVVRRIMLRLTQPGEGVEDTRRRARKRELLSSSDGPQIKALEDVLHRLVEARLVTASRDLVTGEELVDVSHEALIRGWAQLRSWIDEDRVALRTHRQLTEAAGEWERHHRDQSYLYHGARLAQAEEWLEVYPDDPNELERAFLLASREAAEAVEREKEQARQRELAQAQALAEAEHQRADTEARASRRLRALAAGLAIIFVLAIGAAILARSQQQEARRQAATAEARQIVAEVSQGQAVAAGATAEAERNEAERQARLVTARQLAALAQTALEKRPERSLLLALEALNITMQHGELPVTVAEQALREALAGIGGRNLSGHTGPILDVAISPDDRWLITAGKDGTARRWDLDDPAASPVVFTGHEGAINAIAISPDNRWLVTGGDDDTARRWDLNDPTATPVVLTGHEDIINAVAISSDNRWLVTGSADTTARLWNLQDPTGPPVILTGHEDQIDVVAISPNSRWLATGSKDGTARLWDLNDPTADPVVLTGHPGGIETLTFSPNNQWLVTTGATEHDNVARLWDLNDPTADPMVLSGHVVLIKAVAFSPDNHWLATGGDWRDNTIRLWNLDDLNAPPVVLSGHASGINRLLFSPDNHWLISGSAINGDNTVRLWDLNDPNAPSIVLAGHDDEISDMAISSDNRWLATGSWDTIARVWDLRNPTRPPEPRIFSGHEDSILAVALSRDNRWLITGSGDDTGRVWDLKDPTADPIILTDHDGQINAVAVSSDNQWLATGSHDTTARLWDMTDLTAAPIVLSGHEKPIYGLAISPDNHWLATGSEDQTVRVWDMSNLDVSPIILTDHDGLVLAVTFSPDNRWLVSSGLDKTVRLWDMADLTAPPIVLTGDDTFSSVAISPDNRWLAAGNWNTTASVWDLADLDRGPTILTGHDSGLSGVAFSPDNRWLATVSGDKTARLWNVNDLAAAPIVLSGHGRPLSGVTFSADGHWLATGSWDTTARVWNLKLTELIDQACRVAGRNLTAEEWGQFFQGHAYHQTCRDWLSQPTTTP